MTSKAHSRCNIAVIWLLIGFLASTALCEAIPRGEHPRPQFYRKQWINLNGIWNYTFDREARGDKEGWAQNPAGFDKQILVPFCPESKLSGVHCTDLIPAIWYHRRFSVPKTWEGQRVFLHFGAVDYDCRAWINGKLVGRHYGGAVSFSFEITEALHAGENQLVVCAKDDGASGKQPLGKQTPRLYDPKKWGTFYMRTTGIWQTVWLEACPQNYIESVHIVPNLDQKSFYFTPRFNEDTRGLQFNVRVLSNDKTLFFLRQPAISGSTLVMPLTNPQVWSPDNPHLYQFHFELLKDGKPLDTVQSYAGLRKFHIEGNRFYLNNKPFYLRFVLDQGFYPDGLWTAPSDEALKQDIENALAVGFNGARLHQKVFEERFHYWADKLGYLSMGEFCDFGMDWTLSESLANYQREWRETVLRDRNHPSIIAWTPFNETVIGARKNMEYHRHITEQVYNLTKALDPTRPVHTVSGYVEVDTTDIYSDHNYHQDPQLLAKNYSTLTPTSAWREDYTRAAGLSVPYAGQPFFVAEYGGTFWDVAEIIPDDPKLWGYGKGVRNEIENKKRANRWITTPVKPTPLIIEDAIADMTEVLLQHPHISGYCWTQLTDIEGEVNGIYTYDRKPKFNLQRMRNIFTGPAAIETP